MEDQSLLSHVMLRVPNVKKTVDYWVYEHDGKTTITRPMPETKDKGADAPLQSAFVELGTYGNNNNSNQDQVPCMSLELVHTSKDNYEIGTGLSYLGVSRLAQLKKQQKSGNGPPLPPGAATETPKEDEPNDIPIKFVASAPGDLLAHIALRSTDLEATYTFYTQILGMDCKAQDETMLCFRYNTNEAVAGVTTTLVFERNESPESSKATDGDKEQNETASIVMGDCFDHVVIVTKCNVNELHDRWKDLTTSSGGSSEDTAVPTPPRIFMKPTDMFGKQVMGLLDPNGYKIILASTS